MLLITTSCNLNCSYCYLEITKTKIMPFELAEEVLSLVSSVNNFFHVQITGGEPLCYPDFFEKFFRLIRRKDVRVSVGIQTNGTLFEPAILKIFRRYNPQITISIDGPPEIQEDLRGKATATFRGLHKLKDYELGFRVNSVVTNVNINFLPKLLLLLGSFPNFLGMGLSLLVKKQKKGPEKLTLPDLEIFKEKVAEFLKNFEILNRMRNKEITFRELEVFKSLVKSRKKEFFCPSIKYKGMAVTPEGEIYPCTQTVYDSYFFSGTLEDPHFNGHLNLKKINKFHQLCFSCRFNSFCAGDCPSRTYYNRNKNLKFLCIMYDLFSKYVNIQTGRDLNENLLF